MNNAQLATASLDDIVFDGRNRTYGAYVLRHLYQRHVTRALGIALALLALLVGGQALARLIRGPEVVVPFVPTGIGNPEVKPMIIDPIVIPPPPVAAVQPPRSTVVPTIQFTPPKIVSDNQQVDKIADQDELRNAVVATKTVVGPEVIDPDGLKTIEGPAEVADIMNPQIFTVVEQMPQLPGGGGTEAIVAAIQRAARYPTQALSAGVEGKVFASFVVNAQGEVTDLKIVKGLGSGLDEETLRAISKLPRFIPGRQNGRAVSVQYTVPISFRMDK
ncbi:hypothetical protein AXW84_01355 [Hymenobacter sp. PAMC 26628]|nr:hypothetical protein AXW84_01355 [Hymenobacter sp. PAMC 26628]